MKWGVFMSFNYEQLLITNELSEIIRHHNQALERLKAYRQAYPYLLAPNLAQMMEENLKDNLQMLYKELNNLHRPKEAQQRHICAICSRVFAIRLPGSVCDECRSRYAPQPVAYQVPSRPAATDGDGDADEPDAGAAAPEDEASVEPEDAAPEEARPDAEAAPEPTDASDPENRNPRTDDAV
jgi:hypothetical protein